MKRRSFLGLLAGGGASLALPARAAAVRPAYVVQIQLSGGCDSMLTIDAKDAAAMPNLDVGYRADERVAGRRRLYGPLFAPLLRHEEALTLVHGVRVDTVGHPDGHAILARGRIDFSPSTPIIGDLIGSALPGRAPIEHLSLQDWAARLDPVSERGYTSLAVSVPPRFVGRVMRSAQDRFGRPGTAAVSEAAEADQAAHVLAGPSLATYLANERHSAALSELLATLPRKHEFVDEHLGNVLHLALHAIENDHAKFINLAARYLWFDSHTDNLNIQRSRVVPALTDIAHFIDELKRRRNAFGSLYDQTTICIGSELGRFPRYNVARGKDHWPENSWMLLGRGLRTAPGGVDLGATGPDYRGGEVDYATGQASGANHRPIRVDSLFATLLHIAGGDARAAGYDDAVLRSILA